ncbi:MAG: LON peptidase substrate-binding domain-containing protein [Fidelibacterota bacterium]|jgi:Lon protease-like protein|tara:strand:- start:1850 stop:2434 length:585 start_codon:yes stop_codon:yes gene_type:complete
MNHLKLFPLSLVSFPTKIVPLHIFEDRYKNLITDCVSNKSEFGIVYQNNNSLAEFGCSMKVIEVVKKYSDGRMDVITKGKNIFKLNSQLLDGELLIGEVKYNENKNDTNIDMFEILKDKYLKILLMLGVTSNLDGHLKKILSFELLEGITLPSEFELMLISTNSEFHRIKILDGIFDKILKNQFPVSDASHFES